MQCLQEERDSRELCDWVRGGDERSECVLEVNGGCETEQRKAGSATRTHSPATDYFCLVVEQANKKQRYLDWRLATHDISFGPVRAEKSTAANTYGKSKTILAGQYMSKYSAYL